MSHAAQIAFVASLKQKHPDLFTNKRVLEIGSLNINGTIRDFFSQCMYIGVDLGAGPCVDLIARGEDLAFRNGAFDVVCSCECFEHNPEWVRTFNNMVRMSNNLVFFSCATTGRAEHGTPHTTPKDAPFCTEYYRNLTEADFREHCDLSAFETYEFSTDDKAHDLYFFGIKTQPKEQQ